MRQGGGEGCFGCPTGRRPLIVMSRDSREDLVKMGRKIASQRLFGAGSSGLRSRTFGHGGRFGMGSRARFAPRPTGRRPLIVRTPHGRKQVVKDWSGEWARGDLAWLNASAHAPRPGLRLGRL